MKRAFSLIELLIVIVIIGVVYTLAVSKLKRLGTLEEDLSFTTLKEYLFSFVKEGTQEIRLLCLDECKECQILVDGKVEQEIESFFDADVESYSYDIFTGLQESSKDTYFRSDGIEEDVCFSLRITTDKVAEQKIVVYKERVYDFTSYFTKTEYYDSIASYLESVEMKNQKVAQ